MDRISLKMARYVMLAAQGLLNAPAGESNKPNVLACIRQMGVLQIDTIHVVARSPYLVLFSRLGNYSTTWLDELAAEGALFEYWAHAACFIPIEDYPLFRRMMLEGIYTDYNSKEWLAEQSETIDLILNRVRNEGPLRSIDFEQTKRPGMWWNWKDEKRILEYLFNQGDLMISKRIKFQRVYDLRERVYPDWSDALAPSFEDVKIQLIKRSIQCMGIARPDWVADYYRLPKKGINDVLVSMVETGVLIPVQVEDMEGLFYVHVNQKPLLDLAKQETLTATHSTLLSPFDPLIWDRSRARQMFNFDYSIESYLPAQKRRYGYFCLPVLIKGRLIGRLDAKAHRSEKRFEVRSFYLEAGIILDNEMLTDLAQAIKACAVWHACPQVLITQSEPPVVAGQLNQMMNK